MPDLIPAGKTSLVKKGTVALQVQTEYANRPYPRITTTILNQGQVLHKVEQKLERAIENDEERSRTEIIIQQQHVEVEKLIKNSSTQSAPPPPPPQPHNQQEQENTNTEPEQNNPDNYNIPAPSRKLSLLERFSSIPGFEHVYQLDNDGHFKTEAARGQFQHVFHDVYRSIPTLYDIFPRYASNPDKREQGVYEVIRDRLYFISTGNECFLVSVNPPARYVDYEKSINTIVLQEE